MQKVYFYLMVSFIAVCTMAVSQTVSAQGFKATGVFGGNISQIDGDTLYGFHKAGLTGGVRLSYNNDQPYDIVLEMLYSERGAATNILSPDKTRGITLSYLEFPVLVSLRDWYIEGDDYYKVRAEAGLAYSVLFRTNAPNYDEAAFKSYDVNWIIGAGLNLTPRVGVSLRYTSSFLKIYDKLNPNLPFKSYFLTLRGEFTF